MQVELQEAVPENAMRFEGHGTHSHDSPHLIHAFAKELLVHIDYDEYRLQEGESLWLGPQIPHAVEVASGGLALGPMLYHHIVPPRPVIFLGQNPLVSSILRHAIFASARTAEEIEPFRLALSQCLLNISIPYFHVPWPKSPLGQAIADAAIESKQTLGELALSHYSSVRQVQRIFVEETGLTFSQWRRRERLNQAYAAASSGLGVAEMVKKSGYASQAGLAKAWAKESAEPFRSLLEANRVH
ncbi:MAG: helix-turn-helix transcriptional regulator [Rothia sp. (in: high G+C Gram-positive bacteria)]|uniref:helix-turn-helix domain-containing protein n=1 Tax=Rothia sp. (in: high G+C Gram-positive bacteria) TaxID=1885016 RepID=UPI002700C9D8|nr:helix-turn-helix transcriptional regulator [Rothia sp. (in: high G+C Gram-positive bacteria)]